MGVKGLQTFIEQHCPGGLIDIDIEGIARDFQQCYGKKPVLVVDGMGCLNKLYTPFMPWIFGGQWVEFLEEVRCFLDAFKRVGIDLVFIFDGVVERAKYAEWVKRRISERHRLVKIFQCIRETGRHPGPKLYMTPSGLGTYTAFALKHLGATVYYSQIDGDTAIFQYYKKHGLFGVLGQDTDFLIYDIERYFSLNSLRYKRKLEVKMYNRFRLCEELQLHPVHLTLLACLLGNDLIPQTELSQFHREITHTSFELDRKPHISQLVPAVAKFLSEMQIGCLTPEVVADLEKRVFNEVPDKSGLMDKVVRQYTCTSNEPAPQSQPNIHTDVLQVIKDRHVNVKIHRLILKVVVMHELLIGVSITDYTDLTMPTAELVYRPIRKRLFSLLLGVGVQDSQRECRTASETTSRLVVGVNAVKEWCFDADCSMGIEPKVIEAEPLSMPGIYVQFVGCNNTCFRATVGNLWVTTQSLGREGFSVGREIISEIARSFQQSQEKKPIISMIFFSRCHQHKGKTHKSRE